MASRVDVRIGDMDVAIAERAQCQHDAEPDRSCAHHQHGAGLVGRHHAADKAHGVAGGADRVEQQRRETVLDVVGDRQQAVFGHRDIFGITARPVPADQARHFQAHLGVAARAGGAAVAMQRDIDGAAAAMQAMA